MSEPCPSCGRTDSYFCNIDREMDRRTIRRAARREALEEAARLCRASADAADWHCDEMGGRMAANIESDIRALIDKEPADD